MLWDFSVIDWISIFHVTVEFTSLGAHREDVE